MMLSIWFKTTVDFSCGFLDCIFIEVGCITEGSIGQIDIEGWISSCLFVRGACLFDGSQTQMCFFDEAGRYSWVLELLQGKQLGYG
jgi:hypothetical protein